MDRISRCNADTKNGCGGGGLKWEWDIKRAKDNPL